MQSRVRTHWSGTTCPRAASSQGRIVQGTERPRLFVRGHIVRRHIVLASCCRHTSRYSTAQAPVAYSLAVLSTGASGITKTGHTSISTIHSSVPEFIDPRFRENKPKTLVFSHWKRRVWACFRENWVYNFRHWAVINVEPKTNDSFHNSTVRTLETAQVWRCMQ